MRKVRSIAGEFTEDIITQAELTKASDLQAMEWQTARLAHRAIEQIERRLLEGAALEDGPLYFDGELKMVRTRRKTAGSQRPERERKTGKKNI